MVAIDLDLTGRRALVCGASAGIGRATALVLASMGCGIVALARREDALRALLPELRAAGAPSAELLVADLDDPDGLAAKIAGLDVQILVNNSGGPPAGRLVDDPTSKLVAAFTRHVLSSHVLVQATLPAMTRAGYGRIVNVLSTSVREPLPNLGTSNTIRGAMSSWSKTLSMELPPGVTINNVLPGYTETDRLFSLLDDHAARQGVPVDVVAEAWRAVVPEHRFAAPSELGGVIAFLCSPAAGYLRGQSIAVDGGRTRAL